MLAPARLAPLLGQGVANTASGLRFLFLGGQGGGRPLDAVTGAQPDTYFNPTNQRWDGGKGLTWTSSTASGPFWSVKDRYENRSGFTAFAWFTCTATGSSSAPLINRENPGVGLTTRTFQLRVNSVANGGQVNFIAFSGSNVYSVQGGPNVVNDGKWHLVVGRYDGQNITVWLDGIQVGTAAGSGIANDTFAGITVGCSANNQTPTLSAVEVFQGTIAAAGLFTRALTPPEVNRLYTEPGALLLQRVTPRRLLAISPVSAVVVPLSASISISDSLSRSESDPRAPADSIGITDTVASKDTDPRGTADSIGITDQLSTSASEPRGTSDTIPMSDTTTISYTDPRSPGDVIPITDTSGRSVADQRANADVIPVSDSVIVTTITAALPIVFDFTTVTLSLGWSAQTPTLAFTAGTPKTGFATDPIRFEGN